MSEVYILNDNTQIMSFGHTQLFDKQTFWFGKYTDSGKIESYILGKEREMKTEKKVRGMGERSGDGRERRWGGGGGRGEKWPKQRMHIWINKKKEDNLYWILSHDTCKYVRFF
jgi:hypothetical protein